MYLILIIFLYPRTYVVIPFAAKDGFETSTTLPPILNTSLTNANSTFTPSTTTSSTTASTATTTTSESSELPNYQL